MARTQRIRLAAFEHRAAVEQHDLVARPLREMQVLGREQNATSARGEGSNRLAEHDDRFGVERRRDLVDEDERRCERERRNDARLAAEPSGERAEAVIEAAVEAERGRDQVRAGGGTLIRLPEGVDERNELSKRQLVEPGRLVRDEGRCNPGGGRPGGGSANPERARIEREQARRCAEECRLARSVRADDADDRACIDAQVDPGERRGGAEPLPGPDGDERDRR